MEHIRLLPSVFSVRRRHTQSRLSFVLWKSDFFLKLNWNWIETLSTT